MEIMKTICPPVYMNFPRPTFRHSRRIIRLLPMSIIFTFRLKVTGALSQVMRVGG